MINHGWNPQVREDHGRPTPRWLNVDAKAKQSEAIQTHRVVTSVLIGSSPEAQKASHLSCSSRTPQSSHNPFKSVFTLDEIDVHLNIRIFNTSGVGDFFNVKRPPPVVTAAIHIQVLRTWQTYRRCRHYAA